MKKVLSLVMALMMCVSLCACGSNEPKEVELTVDNFEEYLSVTFEINNFNEGRLSPDADLYSPTFDLVIKVEAVDSKYKFTDTSLKLILTDKANTTNMEMGLGGAEIVIDEKGNGQFTKEGISWLASAVSEPDYEILKAVSTVVGVATR